MLTHPDMDLGSQQFKEMARDPDALSRAFETGLTKMISQKETLSSVQLSESLHNMLGLLDKLSGSFTGSDRNKMSQDIGKSIAASDPEIARQLTTQNMEHLFGGLLVQYLMAELTQNRMGVTGTAAGGKTGGGNKEGKEREGGSAASGDFNNKLLQVAEKFSMRLQDERTLLDEGLMSVLPKIIEQLIAQKEQESIETMLQRLANNLTSRNSSVRFGAAKSLADIIEHLPDECKNEIVRTISDKLIAWVKSKNVFSSDYYRICMILKSIAQDHLVQKQFAEAVQYLDAFNVIADGAIQKTDDVRNVSVEMINNLASPENIIILLNEIDSTEDKQRGDAGQVFARLGDFAVNDLLDQLRAETDSNGRIRLMHLIVYARERSLPLITGRIKKDEPWYYLRNLAYLLGQIGNEESARSLAPLLQHGNEKLRQEALKSICRIGGSQRGNLLLAALPLADEEFKSDIVEVLGQAKIAKAVNDLLGLLKNRPLIASAARTNLEEKICAALGAVGSPDAIPALSEIAETKSFFSLRAYPDKVKGAAARALSTLRRKVAESGPDPT
jgi:HEAT repeat protein